MTLKGILLVLHISAGCLAIAGMILAMICKKGGLWHRRGGKAYVAGMAVALSLATIISLLTSNVFLFLIGVFSGYFVYTGWRLAVVRNGIRSQIDQYMTQIMLVVAAMMVLYGLFQLITGISVGIALLVFGFIAAQPAWQDFRLGNQWPKGKERIKLHLGRMGGASIATMTAVFVVNVQTNPNFIAWLLPAVVISPLIFYWTRKVAGGSVSV